MIVNGAYFYRTKEGSLEPLCFYDDMTQCWYSYITGLSLSEEQCSLLVNIKNAKYYNKVEILEMLGRI